MKPRPWIQIPIIEILDETERGLVVRFRSGRIASLPKRHIEYVWGAVVVPSWLARKLRRGAPSAAPSHSLSIEKRSKGQ